MTEPRMNPDEQQKQKERQTGGREVYPDGVDVGGGKGNPPPSKPQAERQPSDADRDAGQQTGG